MSWSGKERRKPENGSGRRHYDGTCLLHNVTCNQIISTEAEIKEIKENMATKDDLKEIKQMADRSAPRWVLALFIAGCVSLGTLVGGFGLYKLWDISAAISRNSTNLETLMADFGIRVQQRKAGGEK